MFWAGGGEFHWRSNIYIYIEKYYRQLSLSFFHLAKLRQQSINNIPFYQDTLLLASDLKNAVTLPFNLLIVGAERTVSSF